MNARAGRASPLAAVTVAAAASALTLSAAAAPAYAQGAGDPWYNSSELSFVRTGGNAESATFGIATTVSRAWERTEAKLEAGGIRTRTTRRDRVAVGHREAYEIVDEVQVELSAENYNAQLRVDRRFSGRTSVFVQSGWVRNTFAGVRHRLVNVLGVSTRWLSSDRTRLQTAYGVTETIQRDVVTDPEAANHFVGLRVSSEFWRKLTDNAEGSASLEVDGNGQDIADLRADSRISLSVAMNEHLGLKTSFRTTFDQQPALARIPLRSPAGDMSGEVLLPRKKFDRVATVALVVSL